MDSPSKACAVCATALWLAVLVGLFTGAPSAVSAPQGWQPSFASRIQPRAVQARRTDPVRTGLALMK
ncbi:MAG TPA: hypothetical protein VF744_00430 [Beijerinckiaceae bacterium]|jgi:hypothetical protein